MKINEYKNEVSSLRLSEEFKQELKQKMLAAAENSHVQPEIKKSAAALFNAKYSKYIALAACLLLVVSTVGIVSIGGIRMGSKSFDSSAEAESENDINLFMYIEDDMPVDTNGDAENDIREGMDEDVADYPEESTAVTENYDEEAITTGVDNDEDNPPADTVPRSGNGYSSYASSEYEGDYNGEDYVLKLSNSASNTAENVTVVINLNTERLVPVDTNPHTNNASTTEGVDNSTVDDEEEIDYEDADVSALILGELESAFSYKYYDIRDGVIADLDEVGLIRFTIVDAYVTYDEVTQNISAITMDIGQQTLYSINVNYDYFSSEEVDVDRLLLNDGNYRTQLVGRPVMDGEYIAVVYENDDGILVPIPQLIYAVHRVNGLDIAYHVYSGDGFMVDPGNTNMGLMPEEREVYTTTTNNPEFYTQKAAVRELTYYLRRNILRMDPKLLSFDKSDTAEAEEEEYRSSIRANYPSGKLVVTREDDKVLVNGVGEGDDMQTALKSLLLSELRFKPDATLTLIASEEDGGFEIKVYFTDGIISGIDAPSAKLE